MHTCFNNKTKYTTLLLSVTLFCLSNRGYAETSVEFEWDPYYSNVGYYIGLTEAPIPEIAQDDESEIYDQLLDSTLTLPRFMLFEISVNPLPLLGVYAKKHHPGDYEDAEIRGNVNLIQAFTEGFEEPYAVSLFFGSVVRYIKPGEKRNPRIAVIPVTCSARAANISSTTP